MSEEVIVTVDPVPDVSGLDETICSGETTNIVLSNPNNVLGTTYSWDVISPTNVTGATSGSGSLISQLLTVTDGSTQGTLIYRVTPTSKGCSGSSLDITVTVDPLPTLGITPSQETICDGAMTNILLSTPNAAGDGYRWTVSALGVTGAIDQGSIVSPVIGPIAQPLSLVTPNVQGTVTYTIYAVNSVTGCESVSEEVIVTVDPVPDVLATDQTICSGETTNISITNPNGVPGTTYTWVATPSGNVIGAVNGDGSIIAQTLSTTDSNIGTVIYTITPTSNGCDGPTFDVTVTVNPLPSVDAGMPFVVCEPVDFPVSGTIGGSALSGTWSVISGSGSISSSTVLGNTVSAIYTLDPSDVGTDVVLQLITDDPDAGGPCTAVSDNLTVSINRAPTVSVPSDFSVCEPASIPLTGTIGGSATNGSWSIVAGSGSLSASSLVGNDVHANYFPDITDVNTVLTFRLTTNDPDGAEPCTVVFADFNISYNESPKVNAGPDFSVCEDEVVDLNGSFGGTASMVTWSGGSGPAQFGDVNNPVTTYTLTPADISAGFITLTLTANDPDGAGPCTVVNDDITITVNTLPVVILGGLGAAYAENDPPVTMLGFPVGGQFSGPGVGTGVENNIFNPANANLGPNTITYQYTDPATGCTNFDTFIVVVNELTSIDFIVENAVLDGLGRPQICNNIGLVKLTGIPDASTGFDPTRFESATPNLIQFISNEYFIETDALASGTYFVKYIYTNSLGATNELTKEIIVYATPVPDFSVNNLCADSPLQFTDLSTVPGTPFPTSIDTWNWNFGDNAFSSLQHPMHQYASDGTFNVELTISTLQGCSNTHRQPITVGSVPSVSFVWENACEGDFTRFADETDPGISSILEYRWEFAPGEMIQGMGDIPPGINGGRTTGTFQEPLHQFDSTGVFDVTLTVTTDGQCVESSSQRVFILPFNVIVPTAGNEYFEDFELSNGGWVEEVDSLEGEKSDSISWVFGTPTGEIIHSAASGSSAWWTGANNGSGDASYYNSENSFVNSPCFDLTQLSRPMVSFNFWSDAQSRFDGTVFQYSTDGGFEWGNVGTLNEGINWYNESGLTGNPGQQLGIGWSDTTGGWKVAKFNLNQIPKNLRNSVRFRFAFGSNDDNPEGAKFNGFAFDDVFIGEKSKTVLLEHFTNSNFQTAIEGNANIYQIQDNQIQNPDLGISDFEIIQYHINWPMADQLNGDNPEDPSARSILYGFTEAPRTIMDGLLIDQPTDQRPFTLNGNSFLFNEIIIDQRSLADAIFTIDIDTLPSNSRNSIIVETDITATSSFSEPLLLNVAVVERVINSVDANVYRNVIKRLIYGSGETIDIQWGDGTSVTRTTEWQIDTRIYDPAQLRILAFVQNKNTREIYQAASLDGPPKDSPTVTGIDDGVFDNANQIEVYPNPVSNWLHFNIPNDPIMDYHWKIIDQRGIAILSGDLDFQNGSYSAETKALANGVYHLLISVKEKPLVHKKLVVVNRN